jgi:hypothetical protein
LANTGFSAIARTSLGTYDLTLGGIPPADAKVVPVVTIDGVGAFGIIQANVFGGIVTVRNRTDFPVSGSLGDTAFFIIVSQGA